MEKEKKVTRATTISWLPPSTLQERFEGNVTRLAQLSSPYAVDIHEVKREPTTPLPGEGTVSKSP